MEEYEKKLLNFIAEIGNIMIKNGAEIQRTEQTISRIAASDGKHSAEVFAVPTSVMIVLRADDGRTFSEMKRAYGRRINLEKVIACDRLAVDYIEGGKSLERCIDELKNIDSLTDFKMPVRVAAYSAICMAFTILFRGTVIDGIVAILAGICQGLIMEFMGRYNNISVFLVNVAGSAVVAAVAYFFYSLGIADSYNSIILGSLMPLVPGFAATYAVRDLLYGDYIAGSAKITEALVVSVGIATGIIMTLWIMGKVL